MYKVGLISAGQCLDLLQTMELRKIDELPRTTGLYALADHEGTLHYIGITAAGSFVDRIYSRHINGSEERSHKLACNYNIGRMWRDRNSADHNPADAALAKRVRKEFIRRHCRAVCIPMEGSKAELEALESEVIRLAPPDMVSWNSTRKRVNRLPEPRELVDAIILELGLGSGEQAALERQAQLFDLHGFKDLAP
ncbi:hypothetical protein WJU21_17465 [Emcibacter sp. SYSU 3D8]